MNASPIAAKCKDADARPKQWFVVDADTVVLLYHDHGNILLQGLCPRSSKPIYVYFLSYIRT